MNNSYDEKVVSFLNELANIEVQKENYAAAFMLRDAACLIVEKNAAIKFLLDIIQGIYDREDGE